MAKRIYVGNLPFSCAKPDLLALFSKYGKVVSVDIRTDKTPDGPKAFGYVEMDAGAEKAIEALNRSPFGDKRLEVREAR